MARCVCALLVLLLAVPCCLSHSVAVSASGQASLSRNLKNSYGSQDRMYGMSGGGKGGGSGGGRQVRACFGSPSEEAFFPAPNQANPPGDQLSLITCRYEWDGRVIRYTILEASPLNQVTARNQITLLHLHVGAGRGFNASNPMNLTAGTGALVRGGQNLPVLAQGAIDDNFVRTQTGLIAVLGANRLNSAADLWNNFIARGLTYTNIHTQANPAGLSRGQNDWRVNGNTRVAASGNSGSSDRMSFDSSNWRHDGPDAWTNGAGGDGEEFSGDGEEFSGDGEEFSGDGEEFSGDGEEFSGDGEEFSGGEQSGYDRYNRDRQDSMRAYSGRNEQPKFGPSCEYKCCPSGYYCYRYTPWNKGSTFAKCMNYAACYASNGKKDWGKWDNCPRKGACDPWKKKDMGRMDRAFRGDQGYRG